jgi:UDP-N-acetyl-2-amino-2-deoxyglucuronate dehydrogenase
MPDKVKFAIIGTGMIAERHAKALEASEHAELAGVFDLNHERAKEFSKTNMGVKTYSSFEELLADKNIDAVTIATPTGAHMQTAVPAACAGKHILCEKPLDINLEKADRIIKACKENDVILSAVFQARFSKNVQLIKKALDSGRFGRLLLASAQVKWFRSQEYYDSASWRGTWAVDGGGALMNQSIHLIDLLLYFAGNPSEVSAYTATLTHNIEVEDTVCASVRFKNGAMGVIEASTSCAPGFPRKLELSGEKGSVILEGDAITRWCFSEELPEDAAIRKATDSSNLVSGASDPRAADFEGHRRQIEDLSLAILQNRKPVIPGSEGRRAIELICGIYRSAETKQPVRF